MQTALGEFIRDTAEGHEADAILRSCVHCGFCLSSCPTYRLLGDELDSPRGRIYQIKQLLEGAPVGAQTQLHLDRCLTCRACESACPSGVRYGRLLEIGRGVLEERVPRDVVPAVKRRLLGKLLPNAPLVRALLAAARVLRPLLPRSVRSRLPAGGGATRAEPWPVPRHARRVVLLDGCVQAALEPGINLAAARLLDRVGVSVVRLPAVSCCGAVTHHLAARAATLQQVRRNTDVLWPAVQAGVEAIAMTASACSQMLTEYGQLLRDDPHYALRAARISALARDIAQLVGSEQAAVSAAFAPTPSAGPAGRPAARGARVAFHAPCTLQHGLKVTGVVEPLLAAAGFTLVATTESTLCCGSAGTYSILQPDLSDRLLRGKIAALTGDAPEVIATANIGCLEQLRRGTALPVRHWIELLAERLP